MISDEGSDTPQSQDLLVSPAQSPEQSAASTSNESLCSSQTLPVTPAKRKMSFHSPCTGPSPMHAKKIASPSMLCPSQSQDLLVLPAQSPEQSAASTSKESLCSSQTMPATPAKRKISFHSPCTGPSPSHAKKIAFLSHSEKSDTPSKLTASKKANSLQDFSQNMHDFQDDIDTKLKAVLYSLVTGDSASSVRDGLEKIRRTTKAFFCKCNFMLDDLKKRDNELCQTLHTKELYNSHLHREKNEMREKIKLLKKNQSQLHGIDSSMFDEEFTDEDQSKATDSNDDHAK